MKRFITIAAFLFVPFSAAMAGKADVLEADVGCGSSTCRFSVTVTHNDEGWDHYADRWEIIDTEDNVLRVRELAHPHVNEQPFTRSLGNVIIRAHDSVHSYGGAELTVELRR